MARVFDCFSYYGEADLLEIRLHEMAEVVDYHVVVESRQTYSGQPREIFLDPAHPRWDAFRHKFVHVVVDAYPTRMSPRGRENMQRMAIDLGLNRRGPDGAPLCGPLDLVIVSDVDEIIRARAVAMVRDRLVQGVAEFSLGFYYYHVDQRAYRPDANDRPGAPSGPWIEWTKARAMRRCEMTTPQLLRDLRGHKLAMRLADAGWHFSYLGGVERIQLKIASTAHREVDTPKFRDPEHIAAAMASGDDLFGRNRQHRFRTVEVDDSYPAHLLANRERFAAFFRPTAGSEQATSPAISQAPDAGATTFSTNGPRGL